MKVEKISYGGWQNCVRLSNDVIDLVLTADVGPRIIRFGFINQSNELFEAPEQLGQTGGETWRAYGGHRLWHAPEAAPRTYAPDNRPVRIEEHPGYVRTVQVVEESTGIAKEMDICLAQNGAAARVVHRLRNQGIWPVELAPWALSVMRPGGAAVLPLPPRATHDDALLPVNTLTMWAYTNLADPRWLLGERFLLLRQDTRSVTPQKIGACLPDSWIAYANAGHLFVVQTQLIPGAVYPDMGCSIETYTEAGFLEVETLGPLGLLRPGQAVEHVETWRLLDGVPCPGSEQDVIDHVLPVLQPALASGF